MKNKDRVDFFIENGWTALPGAFTAEQAAPHVRRVTEILKRGPQRDRFDAGGRPIGTKVSSGEPIILSDFAPAAWQLIVELVGGEEAIVGGRGYVYSDEFVCALPGTSEWRPPSIDGFRWHVDVDEGGQVGLRSMRNGLAVYALWSDVEPRGGGTFLAPGAVAPLARHLKKHAEEIALSKIPLLSLLEACDPRYFEMVGALGTFFLAHPLMVHAPSMNASRRPRLLTVRPIELTRPPRLSGPAARRTPVERATLRALSQG